MDPNFPPIHEEKKIPTALNQDSREKELGLPNPIHKDNVLFSWNRQVLIAIMTWFIPATWTTLKQTLTLPLSLHVTM